MIRNPYAKKPPPSTSTVDHNNHRHHVPSTGTTERRHQPVHASIIASTTTGSIGNMNRPPETLRQRNVVPLTSVVVPNLPQQQSQPKASTMTNPTESIISTHNSSDQRNRHSFTKQTPRMDSQPKLFPTITNHNQNQNHNVIDLTTSTTTNDVPKQNTTTLPSSGTKISSQLPPVVAQQLPPQQTPHPRPSSSSSSTLSIATTVASSQSSQTQLVWNNTYSNNQSTKRNDDSNKKTSTTTAMMIDRYHNTLPPEIRFTSNDSVTKPIQDEHRTELVKNASLSEPLLNGWTLYSHQKRAILVSLLMRRHILALDMGLGKTIIGCCWARAFVRTIPNVRVIIICPVSLKEEWQRTAHDIVGLSIHCDSDTNPKPRPRKKAKVHDDHLTDENHINGIGPIGNGADGVVTIASWAKVPHPEDVLLQNRNHPYVVVADEAHSMQSMNSARTREALHLMLAPNAVGVLLLTGTPMKNGKPANLFPLLRAVKHPFGNHQRAYEAHFCGGRDMSNGATGGRPMWVATGAANLDQLRVLTKSHMLHMTKDDVLKELPKQTRVKKTVFVSSKSQMRHNDAMRKLSLVYENRNDPFQQEAILGAVQNMRLVDSFAKVAATVEVAREVLRKEAAVVIFTSFVDVAKMVHEKLNEYGWTGELLTGETPAKKRQGMVDKFQNGLSPVFCCTFGAGGVGLTLTAASTVILLDRPWTPGDVHQAEDRVRRIGQTKPVTSIWMSAFELDKQIDEMIESKSQTSSTVLSEQSTAVGSSGSSSSTNAPKLSILKMVHSFLSSQASSSSGTGGYKQATLPDYGHGTFKTY